MTGEIIVEAHCKLENKRILGVEGGIPQIKVSMSQFGQIHEIDVYTFWREFGKLNPCVHGLRSVADPIDGSISGTTFYQLI
jgi:hypothetical protein